MKSQFNQRNCPGASKIRRRKRHPEGGEGEKRASDQKVWTIQKESRLMFTLEAMKLLGIACSGYYGFAKLYPSLLVWQITINRNFRNDAYTQWNLQTSTPNSSVKHLIPNPNDATLIVWYYVVTGSALYMRDNKYNIYLCLPESSSAIESETSFAFDCKEKWDFVYRQ